MFAYAILSLKGGKSALHKMPCILVTTSSIPPWSSVLYASLHIGPSLAPRYTVSFYMRCEGLNGKQKNRSLLQTSWLTAKYNVRSSPVPALLHRVPLLNVLVSLGSSEILLLHIPAFFSSYSLCIVMLCSIWLVYIVWVRLAPAFLFLIIF